MGTRHSIIAIVGGKTKLAQYGQWDGYPSVQGVDILKTLRTCNLDELREKVENLQEISEEEYEALWKEAGHDGGQFVNMEVGRRFLEKNPHLSRDCGANILGFVLNGVAQKVQLNELFPADSLFCEWCYVIDFDKRTFEVYKGFNNTPLEKGERFYRLQELKSMKREREECKKDGRNVYYPVRLLKDFSLDNLPEEDAFLAALEQKTQEQEQEQE